MKLIIMNATFFEINVCQNYAKNIYRSSAVLE